MDSKYVSDNYYAANFLKKMFTKQLQMLSDCQVKQIIYFVQKDNYGCLLDLIYFLVEWGFCVTFNVKRGDRTFVYTVISSMGQKLSTVVSSMGKSEHCTFVYFDKQRTLLSSMSKLSTVISSTRGLYFRLLQIWPL